MNSDYIVLTQYDRDRLQGLIDASRTSRYGDPDYLQALQRELLRATVVPSAEVPADVITLNSKARLLDLDSGRRETYTIVPPHQHNPENKQISVFAPLGTALLGCRVNETVELPMPVGVRRLEIEEVVYQPERAGAFDL